jgi:hypothetical protein
MNNEFSLTYKCDECSREINADDPVSFYEAFPNFCSKECYEANESARSPYVQLLQQWERETECFECHTAERSSQPFFIEGFENKIFAIWWCDCVMSAHIYSLNDKNKRHFEMISPVRLYDIDTGEVIIDNGDDLAYPEPRHELTAYIQMNHDKIVIDARQRTT